MSWALIAGGSRGIGLSIAEALAKRKYNLLLVARNNLELARAKTQLEHQYNIQVDILPCDLSLIDSSKIIYDWCVDKNLEIKILCNAAGLGGSKDFPELQLSDLRTMVRLNLESAIALSFMFIPLLKQTAPSYILNIGSMAGFAPIPNKNIYAATKSALHSFSYSLKYLLKENNISVSCVCPGPVFTKSSIEKETIKQLGWIGKRMAVKSARVGEYAVQGMLKGKMIIIPGKLATLFSCLIRILPKRFVTYIFYALKK
jgi:Short-chain dehydrogenases of various substrate specificities